LPGKCENTCNRTARPVSQKLCCSQLWYRTGRARHARDDRSSLVVEYIYSLSPLSAQRAPHTQQPGTPTRLPQLAHSHLLEPLAVLVLVHFPAALALHALKQHALPCLGCLRRRAPSAGCASESCLPLASVRVTESRGSKRACRLRSVQGMRWFRQPVNTRVASSRLQVWLPVRRQRVAEFPSAAVEACRAPCEYHTVARFKPANC